MSHIPHAPTTSKINQLPHELLSTILLEIMPPSQRCQPFRRKYTNLTAYSLVCHLWCQVIRGTPQLWSSCELVFVQALNWPTPEFISALQTFFSRSGKLPLTLSVELKQYDSEVRRELYRLEEFILSLGERWSSLRFLTEALYYGEEIYWASAMLRDAARTASVTGSSPFKNVVDLRYTESIHEGDI